MIKSYFNVCPYILNIYFRAIITESYSLLFYEVTAIKILQHIIQNWAFSVEKTITIKTSGKSWISLQISCSFLLVGRFSFGIK